jgi:single-stranded DNA-binding protein
MIRCLATGTLYGSPQSRTSAAGKPYVTGKLRADGKDGSSVWCSLIAFSEVGERLASLQQGAAVAVAGRAEVSAWINRDGEAAGGLSMVVDELATLKGKPKPRTPKPRQPETAGAGFDDYENWRP